MSIRFGATVAGVRLGLVVIGIGCTMACSNLTKVSAPDLVQPSSLDNPQGAVARYAGVVPLFTTAFDSATQASGLISDELNAAYSIFYQVDDRTIAQGAASIYPFPVLSQVRINSLLAIAGLEQYDPGMRGAIGELFALNGYVELLFAEHLCSGVPLSVIANAGPVYGAPLPRDSLLAHAVADFDSALAHASDSMRVKFVAQIGRGRALLDLGQPAAAAGAVAGVPTAYAYLTQQSSAIGAQDNLVYRYMVTNRGYTVADREGGNGLDFVSGLDPRVRTQSLGLGTDGITPIFAWTALSGDASPLVIASGVEARLIEAEAALSSGDTTGWAATLNALRADTVETGITGLPPLPADSTTTATPSLRVDVMFRERAFWLFLSSHRQGDLRRLIRQYGRTQDQVFPVGPYKLGGQYGSDVTFSVEDELSNPKFSRCLNRDA